MNEEGLEIENILGMMMGIVMLTLVAAILPKPKAKLEVLAFELS